MTSEEKEVKSRNKVKKTTDNLTPQYDSSYLRGRQRRGEHRVTTLDRINRMNKISSII